MEGKRRHTSRSGQTSRSRLHVWVVTGYDWVYRRTLKKLAGLNVRFTPLQIQQKYEESYHLPLLPNASPGWSIKKKKKLSMVLQTQTTDITRSNICQVNKFLVIKPSTNVAGNTKTFPENKTVRTQGDRCKASRHFWCFEVWKYLKKNMKKSNRFDLEYLNPDWGRSITRQEWPCGCIREELPLYWPITNTVCI